jgi:hypothetical protein
MLSVFVPVLARVAHKRFALASVTGKRVSVLPFRRQILHDLNEVRAIIRAGRVDVRTQLHSPGRADILPLPSRTARAGGGDLPEGGRLSAKPEVIGPDGRAAGRSQRPTPRRPRLWRGDRRTIRVPAARFCSSRLPYSPVKQARLRQ